MAADLDPLEQHLLQALRSLPSTERRGDAPDARALWRAQVDSRLCDHAARWLQSKQLGYYTIGSAGHESNAALALALRPTDPALLHYRSGGFYLARSGQVEHDGVVDILLGMAAAVEEPIAGGRHKVFGHADLAVIPQTSTIASHLPRAVGVAFAVDRAARLGVESRWPRDAVTVCSFGDASLDHAVAQAGLNTAAHCVHQRLPLAALFVCEDNGLGSASHRQPAGWRARCARGRSSGSRALPVTTVRRCSTSPGNLQDECARSAGRPSSICAPCDTSPTPEPISRPPTGPRGRSEPTTSATRYSPQRAGSSRQV